MDIIIADKKEPFKYAVVNQKEIVADMSKAVVPKILSLVHSWVQSKMYYVVRYDAIHNPDECKRFAIKFAAHPLLFLNGRRTGIEIDYSLITVCAGSWISCDKLVGESLNYTVEYYISMLNGFPHTIFFRIDNTEESYKEKIEYFINSLLGEEVKQVNGQSVKSKIETIDTQIDVESDETEDDDQQITIYEPRIQFDPSTHHIIIYRGYPIIVPRYITKTGMVVLGICMIVWVTT